MKIYPFFLAAAALSASAQTPQIDNIISQLTLDEKINIVVGANRLFELPPDAAPGMPARPAPDWEAIGKIQSQKVKPGVVTAFTEGRVPGAAGELIPVERLGLTTMILADGPAGVRIDPVDGHYATAFPTGSLLSASFDTDMVESMTKAMGNEVKEYGVDVLLAPAINIMRSPLCGRNFEYYSEDPLLAGKIAAAYIRGIQSNGVGTSLKHFAVNNQETMRNGVNANVSDRALREIYLRPFEIAVKEAQPWTIMSSYNKINGVLASENRWLLTDILRNEWGYDGFVMTDWWAEQDGARQIKAGNDMLMPGSVHQADEIRDAIASKRLDERFLDSCVARILNVLFKSPTYNRYEYSNAPDLEGHAAVARKAATEGMVLMQNDDRTLPLKPKSKIALFGTSSYDILVGGTGSGNVNRKYKVSLDEGLRNAGFKLDKNISEKYTSHVAEHKAKTEENFWTVPVVPELAISEAEAEKCARANDAAILTIGRMAGEGGDRHTTAGDWYLSDMEKANLDAISKAFRAAGKPVVVVLNMGNIIDMKWDTQADAILHAWLPGQEGGNAIADVLSGKVNPSGRLPMTVAYNYTDYPSSANFPSSDGVDGSVDYDEDIFVGYRGFEASATAPAYPFGFGLSYTDFTYSNLNAARSGDSITLSVDVANSGKKAGKDAILAFASAPESDVAMPVRELRAFAKTALLKPGASQTVKMEIPVSDLRYFDEFEQTWKLPEGTWTISVGDLSTQIYL